MAEDSQRDDSPPQGGVFGNLPDTRPGARSPRRRRSGDAAAAKATAAAPKRAEPASKRTAAEVSPETAAKIEPSRPAQTPPEQPQPGRDADGRGIEELAWAGVAVAAEAATLGVRLASRALDAMRGNPERD